MPASSAPFAAPSPAAPPPRRPPIAIAAEPGREPAPKAAPSPPLGLSSCSPAAPRPRASAHSTPASPPPDSHRACPAAAANAERCGLPATSWGPLPYAGAAGSLAPAYSEDSTRRGTGGEPPEGAAASSSPKKPSVEASAPVDGEPPARSSPAEPAQPSTLGRLRTPTEARDHPAGAAVALAAQGGPVRMSQPCRHMSRMPQHIGLVCVRQTGSTLAARQPDVCRVSNAALQVPIRSCRPSAGEAQAGRSAAQARSRSQARERTWSRPCRRPPGGQTAAPGARPRGQTPRIASCMRCGSPRGAPAHTRALSRFPPPCARAGSAPAQSALHQRSGLQRCSAERAPPPGLNRPGLPGLQTAARRARCAQGDAAGGRRSNARAPRAESTSRKRRGAHRGAAVPPGAPAGGRAAHAARVGLARVRLAAGQRHLRRAAHAPGPARPVQELEPGVRALRAHPAVRRARRAGRRRPRRRAAHRRLRQREAQLRRPQVVPPVQLRAARGAVSARPRQVGSAVRVRPRAPAPGKLRPARSPGAGVRAHAAGAPRTQTSRA